jgi:hypothetical protein
MVDVLDERAVDMSDQALPVPAVKSYFPNLGAAARWAALAVVGFFVVYKRYRGIEGLVGGAVGLFAFQASLCYVIGVRVKANRVTLPRPLLKRVPLLVFGRTSFALSALRDVTAAGQFLGFDVVLFSTSDGAVETVFASRQQRLAFFEAIKHRLPDIRIYRAY